MPASADASVVNRQDVLVAVAPDKVEAIWPHVAGFLNAAFMNGRGDDTPDSLKADLIAGRDVLWVVWDGRGLLCAATTKIYQAPRRKICLVTACGGREMMRWVNFIEDLAAYAKHEACDVIRVEGREGWKAMLRDFTQPFIVLERAL